MNQSMGQFQIERRAELAQWPITRATAVPTNGKGSRGNTAHLNLTKPMPTTPRPSISIPARRK